MKTTFFLSCFFTLILVATGCSQYSGDRRQQSAHTTATQIQRLLSDAQDHESPLREQQQLQAIQLLLQEKQWGLAEQVLDSIQATSLPLPVYGAYIEVQSLLHIQRGEYTEALSVIESPRLLQGMDALPLDQQLTLSRLRATIFALVGNHLASARQRIYIDPLLDGDQQTDNRAAIWRSLMYLSVEELKLYFSKAFSEDFKGWLELALIAKDKQSDLDEQIRLLDDWQLRWANHPAAQALPGGMGLLRKLAANRPQQVALLLPLTGKLAPFGKAIRDGFIAAMYQTRGNGGQVPKLNVYDTESSDDIVRLYHQAVDNGADMVVGPLEKQRVRLLFDEVELPVTTLSLNRIEDYGMPPVNLFQFGLAPQDEAQQMADIAFLENRKNALLIAPQGEWGQKVSQAFADRLQQLGGSIVASSTFSGQDDYSSSIKSALLLQSSEQRARRIQNLIGERIEFLPRRREDIDMVFLLARPQQARSIKPLLAFHYAGDLPVYATSHSYSGIPAPAKDRDINGMRFTDIPWVLNKPEPLYSLIDAEISQSKAYQRMYALGIDSFQLHSRLHQLELMPNSRVYGQTGTLKLNQHNAIERQMLLAKIRRGRAKLIPLIDQSLNDNLHSRDGNEIFNYKPQTQQTMR